MTNDKFEDFLKEFEPKPPRALPFELIVDEKSAAGTQWKRLAAAAVIVLVCGGSLWNGLKEVSSVSRYEASEKFAISKKAETQKKSAFEWTKAALEGATFEGAVEKEVGKTLPRLDGPDSTLRVLAKE